MAFLFLEYAVLRIFHHNTFYQISYMFTGIGTLLEILVDLPPGDNVQWIFVRIRMELVHTGDKQLVGFFLQCIDADNVIFEGFGVFKIGEIFQKNPHF